jgi:putative restriction endonuclease
VAVNEILELVDNLNVWTRGSERAPHKPLLLLLALGRLSQGEQQLPFSECEDDLTELLREFGPSRRTYHPEYPFWRLQNDGLWQVSSDTPLVPRKSNTDPSRSQLRQGRAVGHFPSDIRSNLIANPALVVEIAQRLLSAHFPASLHEDILSAVGLPRDGSFAVRRPRDPQFRTRVLTAYEYRCALCGLDLRIRNITIAIEAAHIQWYQAGGPDTEANGIALCSLHHKVFDLGAFTIHTDYRILVSQLVHGSTQFEHVLLRHHGQAIRRPSRPEHTPDTRYLAWHRQEVFKEGPRFLDGAMDKSSRLDRTSRRHD